MSINVTFRFLTREWHYDSFTMIENDPVMRTYSFGSSLKESAAEAVKAQGTATGTTAEDLL